MENVLLIIGNGFDLFHGLPTSYSKFKEYLIEQQERLILEKVVEQSKIERLCEDIHNLNMRLHVSKNEIKAAIRDEKISELICDIYNKFLGELYSILYSKEFLEERGFCVDNEEIDNDKIQKLIRTFEKIINEIKSVAKQKDCCKDICVLHNIPYEEMDEIEVIEFILRTFDEIEYFMKMNGKDAWSCFEESCGIIDFQYFLNQIPDDLFCDKEGDLDGWLRDDLMLPMITPYVSVLSSSLPTYFASWISTINVKDATFNEDFKNFFEKYDVSCLSFNYTDTVEKLYGHNAVFHIHGRQNEEIHVGHGNGEIFEDESNMVLEDAMCAVRCALKKDTSAILKSSERTFFSELDTSIRKIFVYGFSFGEVDNPYLVRINDILPNAEWYVQAYFSEEFPKFRDRLMSVGVMAERVHHWYNVNDVI